MTVTKGELSSQILSNIGISNYTQKDFSGVLLSLENSMLNLSEIERVGIPYNKSLSYPDIVGAEESGIQDKYIKYIIDYCVISVSDVFNKSATPWQLRNYNFAIRQLSVADRPPVSDYAIYQSGEGNQRYSYDNNRAYRA